MDKQINDGGPAFPQPYPPQAFQKAMAFIDGTSLFYRLRAEKLVVPSLISILRRLCVPRELVRAYVYTTQPQLDQALAAHGENFLVGCRVVLGDAIATGDGNFREKGVDALLVADLIYHAASRNCDVAFVLTHDTDFCQALRRVEDFGCRTAVVAIGVDAPDRLRASCDQYVFVGRQVLLEHLFARETEQGAEGDTVNRAAEPGR